MVVKKNFLILAIVVGFIGLILGSYTMFLSINDIIKPQDHRVIDDSIDLYYAFIPLIANEIDQAQSKWFTFIQSTIPTISSKIDDKRIPMISNKNMECVASLTKQHLH